MAESVGDGRGEEQRTCTRARRGSLERAAHLLRADAGRPVAPGASLAARGRPVLLSSRLPLGFRLTHRASYPLASGSPPTTFRVRAVLLPDVCAEEVMRDEVILREVELPTCLICGRMINAGQPRYRVPEGDVEVRCYEQSGRSFVTTRALAPHGSSVSGRDIAYSIT